MTDQAMNDSLSSFDKIIRQDTVELERLGIDTERIAVKLESLLELAKEGLECPVHLGKYTIRAQWDRGLIPCPMGEPGLFPKIAVELTLQSGKVLQYSLLSVHLIRSHGFFGEPGRLFRIEPKEVSLLLD
jgi:hypothetical protein